MIKVKHLAFILLFCFPLVVCKKASQQQAGFSQSESEFVMGTICAITLFAPDSADFARVFNEAFKRLHEIENLMSATVSGAGGVSGADINRVNHYAGQYALRVSAETIAVVERALYYAELSDGAFDPTVGPLVKLWGIGTETPKLPSQDEIAQALSLVNWRDVSIEPEPGALFLKRPGMSLDLGAIAKGYAADEVVRIIAKAGIPSAIIDLGGNIFAYGLKNPSEPAAPWRIGVQNPLDIRGAYLGILELQNKSVVTSGVYERYADIDGIHYHHILSTRDGYPVRNGLLSVTIIASSSIESDALSTMVFALGYEHGRALVETMDGVEALFVFEDKTIRATSGAQAVFTLSDAGYHVLSP
ncbi:MAG: FAD:protein FMN transferase [Treponema sp.]|jgi:thiamine biosynthesis lipoprotein|nr:FAD:protein FMN transferase [Treponema sp.]